MLNSLRMVSCVILIISLWNFSLKSNFLFHHSTVGACVFVCVHVHTSSDFSLWLTDYGNDFVILCFYSHLLMKTHQIPIGSLLIALKYNELKDIDLDETQCIVSNLIYEGKIKGYISHQHKKLVVSKQNAFPGLNTLS